MTQARTGPGTAAAAVLEVEGLAVARGGRLVVTGVTFRLLAGEALEVTGANGAGKSSLLRVLAGLLRAEAGRVRLLGGDPGAGLAEKVHYVGHRDGLKAGLTAGENLTAAARLLGPPGRSPREALAALGLERLLDLPVSYLSAGQRRRIALARLLVAARPLWVLDEPATALDTKAREGLAAIMAAHRQAGGLIVAATHASLHLTGARQLKLAA